MPELIADYEGQVGTNKEEENLLFRLIEQNLQSFFYAHFTPSNIYKIFNDPTPVLDNKIRNIKQNDFDELSVKLEVMQATIAGLLKGDKKLKAVAANIIDYVRKQYNLGSK